MTKLINATILLILFTISTSAQAATIQWDFFEVGLNPVPVIANPTPQTFSVAGYFDYDTVTGSLANRADAYSYQIFENGIPTFKCVNNMECNFSVVSNGVSGGSGTLPSFDLYAANQLDGSLPIMSGAGFLFNEAPFGTITSGAFVDAGVPAPPPSAAPLPAALPMFGAGLMALAALAWRKHKTIEI